MVTIIFQGTKKGVPLTLGSHQGAPSMQRKRRQHPAALHPCSMFAPRIEKVVVWWEKIYSICIHIVNMKDMIYQCTYLNIMYIMGYHSMQNTTTTWSDPNGNTSWKPGALRVLGISFQNLDMFFLCSRVSFFLGSVTSRISPHGSKCSFKCFSEIAFGKPWTNTRNLSSLTQH